MEEVVNNVITLEQANAVGGIEMFSSKLGNHAIGVSTDKSLAKGVTFKTLGDIERKLNPLLHLNMDIQDSGVLYIWFHVEKFFSKAFVDEQKRIFVSELKKIGIRPIMSSL